ncbi:hypothetical protein MRX96_018092 [Rhipicephalus microplus]
MEVTAENFKEQFGVLKAALENASFVAIDCEFTGLELERSTHAYDTPEERYQKLRESSLDFLVVQVGVCVFQHDKEKRGYKMFRCQASSLQFLSQHGFDFNKLFSHGVSYLRMEEAAQLSQALSERHEQQLKGRRLAEQRPVQDIQGGGAQGQPTVHRQHPGLGAEVSGQCVRHGDGSALHLSECNGFKRKLIYQEVNARFGDKVQLTTESDSEGMLHIAVRITGTPEEQRARLELKQKKEREDLELAHGFGRVLELLAASGKLVVGHNMLLDIMHLLYQFVDDLPQNYNEFKSMVRAAFPCLVDTKVLASDNQIKDSFATTALGLLLKQLRCRPSCVPPVESETGYGYNLDQAKFHDAGFDAFVTGMCLLGLCHQLGKYKDHTLELKETSPILKPYLNRVHMMKSPDIPTLNMAGNDVIPSRSHILHATFPTEWRANDFHQLFNSFGQITIYWINSTQAFIAMASSPLATQALKKLGSKNTSTQDSYCLQSYSTYITKLRCQRDTAAVVTANKKSSPGHSDETVEETGMARKRKRSASLTSLGSSQPRVSKEESGD